jgi:rhamnosyltransferase
MHDADNTTSSPNVLVLLACFNGEKWIARQLESILTQERVSLRVTIRDDGSSDATLGVISGFTADGRITLAPPSAHAHSAAQNFLTLIRDNSAAGFDYVAFADQDDVWYSDKLSRACRLLRNADSVGYSSATVAEWEDGRSMLLSQSTAAKSADFLFEGAGQGCTFVLRADFYAQVRHLVTLHEPLTRAIHYHDWLIYAVARALGRKWTFDPAPSVHYRQHGGNDTGARGRLTGIAKRLNLIRGRWYRNQLIAIAEICEAAAATNAVVSAWRSILLAQGGLPRRVRIALFCMRNGRRRRTDTMVLIFAALAGWI